MTNRFDAALEQSALPRLAATTVDTLQINVGKLCNQACRHCHVDAGPHQNGSDLNMGAAVVDAILRVLQEGDVRTIDMTGGAPELNPNFRRLVTEARQLGVQVLDRCNLSVLFEPGQEDLAEFLAEHRVAIVASLPFYKKDRTDRQRGAGVFDKSVLGLQKLNALGYGQTDALELNLVFNPVGAYLPGGQAGLQANYKKELFEHFGIQFHNLFCITNMPIARFADWLEKTGNLESYMETLVGAFNPTAVAGVMCRNLISIGPDGSIFDCDFNQMLALPVHDAAPRNILDFDLQGLLHRRIVTADHCLGCTAGAGSSCGGSLTVD
jgi:radical SAM/Cys-rich protein